jgi:putative transposase
MARLPRLAFADQLHLVIHSSIDGRAAFVDEADRRAFLDALRQAAGAEGVAVHAYALLDGEVLLALTPHEPAALSRLVQAVGRRYVSVYNRRHGRRGPLWEGRFRCAVVDPALALDTIVFVDAQSDVPDRTSAAHRTGGPRDALITDPPAYWQIGNTPFDREAGYRALVARGLPAALAGRLRAAALGGWACGSPAFLASLRSEGEGARPLSPRPRGRPRRDA